MDDRKGSGGGLEVNQRKILEAAAKACRLSVLKTAHSKHGLMVAIDENSIVHTLWNPLTNPADTAEMCAKLALDTAWGVDDVIVMVPEEEAHEAQYKDHDNSRLKAWMYAATMCAAKIGGYE